jgi:hypothetical protein
LSKDGLISLGIVELAVDVRGKRDGSGGGYGILEVPGGFQRDLDRSVRGDVLDCRLDRSEVDFGPGAEPSGGARNGLPAIAAERAQEKGFDSPSSPYFGADEAGRPHSRPIDCEDISRGEETRVIRERVITEIIDVQESRGIAGF